MQYYISYNLMHYDELKKLLNLKFSKKIRLKAFEYFLLLFNIEGITLT